MSRKWQAAIWLALWGFWGMVSRNNHPTLLLNSIATGLLLGAFASAIYFNGLVLVPRYWKRRRFPAYWVSLILAMSILTALDVVVIQKAYDLLWGPDARRFGFWVNFGLDFTGMALHLLAAAGILWLIGRKQRNLTG